MKLFGSKQPIEIAARVCLERETRSMDQMTVDGGMKTPRSYYQDFNHVINNVDHNQIEEEFPKTYRYGLRNRGRYVMDQLAQANYGQRVDMEVVRSLPFKKSEAIEVLNKIREEQGLPPGQLRPGPGRPPGAKTKKPETHPDNSRADTLKLPPAADDLDVKPVQAPSPLDEVQKRILLKNSLKANPKKALPEGMLREEIGKKLAQVLFYIDGSSLGKAKLSELSQMLRVLFEAKQLLDGKPTTILNREEKQELRSLLPRLIEEAKRRGLVVKDVKGRVIDQAKKGAD